jgi:hypothetical protein
MAIVAEDGFGLQTSNAYVDIPYVSAYLLGEQLAAWGALSETEQEAAIIRATRAVDALYDWKGTRKTLEQSFNWPRVGIEFEGFEIIGVPAAVKKATAEAVGLFLDGAEFFSGEADVAVTSERVDVISVSYAAPQAGANREATKFEVLNRLVKGLIKTGNGSGGFGSAPVLRT